MDIVSSSCKPRIVCRWPFAVASVEASADDVTANVNFILCMYVSFIEYKTGRIILSYVDDDYDCDCDCD